MAAVASSLGETRPAKSRWWRLGWEWVTGIAVCLVPCGLLFERGANFFYDWHNHQWLVGYFGEYLRLYHHSPDVLSVTEAVAMPQPIFYGFLLYPCLGVLSALVGASLAIRLGVGLTLAVQFGAVYLAGKRLSGHRGVGVAVAATVTWSVHSLTNLYNRAALTEFFAVAFLTTAVVCGVFAVVGARSFRGRRAAGWLATGFGVLTVGSHPPTALVGAGLLAALVPLGWIALARSGGKVATIWRGLAVAVGLGAVTLAPWVYANLRLHGELGIVGKYRDFSFSSDHIDAGWARFSPVPPDLFWTGSGQLGETPYVEAPLQMGLLLVVGWNLLLLWRQRDMGRDEGGQPGGLRWLAGMGVIWFGLMVTLSLSPGFATGFRFLAPYVQFATRFVSHANLGLLLLVLATAALVKVAGGYAARRRGTAVLVGLVLAIAAGAVGLKLRHGLRVREHGGEPQFAFTGDRAALVTAGKPDAAGDYAVLRRLPQLTLRMVEGARRVALPVGSSEMGFGRVGEARVNLLADSWVITNVVAYPWSQVMVDGRDVPIENQAAHEFRIALRLPAGEYRITWQWRPDIGWRVLNGAASWSSWILFLMTAVFLVRAIGGNCEEHCGRAKLDASNRPC